MTIIYTDKLKKHLTNQLHSYYIFLGEDFFLIKKNQDLILRFAYQKGFLETITIDIENIKDWEKITLFFKTQNLFFKKTTLIINLIIKKLSIILIKKINEIFFLLNSDVFLILKLNHLSDFFKKKNY